MPLTQCDVVVAVAEAAACQEVLPDALVDALTGTDLDRLIEQIGVEEPLLPAGLVDGLAKTSVAYANVTTDFRQAYENLVFSTAIVVGDVGMERLLSVIFAPPKHTVVSMHWGYACCAASEHLGRGVATAANHAGWLRRVLDCFEAQPQHSSRVQYFIQGLSAAARDWPEPLLLRLRSLAVAVDEARNDGCAWNFVEAFSARTPELCRPLVEARLAAGGGRPLIATSVEALSMPIVMHRVAPEHPLVVASLHASAKHLVTRADFGLSKLLVVWKASEYEPFVACVRQHADELQRIAHREAPHQTVREDTVLYAHMLLSTIAADPSEHVAFIEAFAQEAAPEDRAWLERWMAA